MEAPPTLPIAALLSVSEVQSRKPPPLPSSQQCAGRPQRPCTSPTRVPELSQSPEASSLPRPQDPPGSAREWLRVKANQQHASGGSRASPRSHMLERWLTSPVVARAAVAQREDEQFVHVERRALLPNEIETGTSAAAYRVQAEAGGTRRRACGFGGGPCSPTTPGGSPCGGERHLGASPPSEWRGMRLVDEVPPSTPSEAMAWAAFDDAGEASPRSVRREQVLLYRDEQKDKGQCHMRRHRRSHRPRASGTTNETRALEFYVCALETSTAAGRQQTPRVPAMVDQKLASWLGLPLADAVDTLAAGATPTPPPPPHAPPNEAGRMASVAPPSPRGTNTGAGRARHSVGGRAGAGDSPLASPRSPVDTFLSPWSRAEDGGTADAQSQAQQVPRVTHANVSVPSSACSRACSSLGASFRSMQRGACTCESTASSSLSFPRMMDDPPPWEVVGRVVGQKLCERARHVEGSRAWPGDRQQKRLPASLPAHQNRCTTVAAASTLTLPPPAPPPSSPPSSPRSRKKDARDTRGRESRENMCVSHSPGQAPAEEASESPLPRPLASKVILQPSPPRTWAVPSNGLLHGRERRSQGAGGG
jgi:hypothetical protein